MGPSWPRLRRAWRPTNQPYMQPAAPTNRAPAMPPLVILKRIFQRLPSQRGREYFEQEYSAEATVRIRNVQLFEWLIRALNANPLGAPAQALKPGGWQVEWEAINKSTQNLRAWLPSTRNVRGESVIAGDQEESTTPT